MSTTPARLAANAANAQHSTGPRTPEGRARSSQNARTHGLTARDVVVAPHEREEFEQFLNRYQTDVAPQDAVQLSLFDDLVAAAWNLRRIRRMEVRLCNDATLKAEQLDKDMDRLIRYKASVERTFHRSLKELKALQTNSFMAVTLPENVRAHVPPLANATQITKRTQHLDKTNSLRLLKSLLEAPPPVSAAKPHHADPVSCT
jgi:hypothetical protein